jgi:hypothetical protein
MRRQGASGRTLAMTALGLAVGCGGAAPAPATTETPRAAARVEARAPAAREAPGSQLYPGEHFEADIVAYGLTVGELEVTVEAPCAADGMALLSVRSLGRSAGIVGAVKPVMSEVASWLDAHTGDPIHTRAWLDEEKKHIEAAIDHGEDAIVTMQRVNDGERKERRVRRPGDGPVHDMHSALGALRTLSRAPEGTATRHYLVSAKYLWRVDLRVGGRTTQSAGGQSFDAVHLTGTAVKMHPNGQGGTLGKVIAWELWISDDAERLPLRADLELRGKRARLELAAYERRPAPRGPLAPCW